MFLYRVLFLLLLGACVSEWQASGEYIYIPVSTQNFNIATWQKLDDSTSSVHIYIEGDGHSFNSYGLPTDDPTPHGTFLRDLAMSDDWPNVVYMARPCQFIMSEQCNQSDWTDGRFSERIINSMAYAIKSIAGNRDIVLIGYSGGAMVSGLVIQQYPELDVKQWITIAGVLNHKDWTEYFGDSPLDKSLNLTSLPDVSQIHYAAEYDSIVPLELTEKATGGLNVLIIKDATHDKFKKLDIAFDS